MTVVRARDLRPGDVLFFTLETVVRAFSDAMTDPHRVNLLLRKGSRERVTTYIRRRQIRVVRRTG